MQQLQGDSGFKDYKSFLTFKILSILKSESISVAKFDFYPSKSK